MVYVYGCFGHFSKDMFPGCSENLSQILIKPNFWQHLFSFDINIRQKKVVFTVTCLGKNGSVGRDFFLNPNN